MENSKPPNNDEYDFIATMINYKLKIMKSKKELIILFFLLIFKVGIAQVTPIETVVDTKKTTYSTKLHRENKVIVKNQSYELKQKIQENIKINNNFNLSFIRLCLDEATIAALKNENISFSIEYIGKQDGEVISCSLINYGNRVSLTDSQIECILTKAMTNVFTFDKIPNDVNEFYFKIRKYYKFK